MTRATLLIILDVPDDYAHQPFGEAMAAISAAIPAELLARGHAAIGDCAERFIALSNEMLGETDE